MSLSLIIPQLLELPTMFSQQFVTQIQQQVQTHLQFINLLSQYLPAFPASRILPIFKEQFFKCLVTRQAVQQSIVYLYSFMTGKNYSIQQKSHVLNFVYKLIYLMSQIGMTKEIWKLLVEKQTVKMAKMFYFQVQQSQYQTEKKEYTPPLLSVHQSQELRHYITRNILPFYELWQKLLDQNQQFRIASKFYQPTQISDSSLGLATGHKLQLNELLSIQLLKEYIGEKLPLEEKKDLKKK